jgi:hypothetical protein
VEERAGERIPRTNPRIEPLNSRIGTRLWFLLPAGGEKVRKRGSTDRSFTGRRLQEATALPVPNGAARGDQKLVFANNLAKK